MIPPPSLAPSPPPPLLPVRVLPMRIALVSLDGHLPRYGIGAAVVRLAGALARGGDDVTLFVRHANAEGLSVGQRVRVVGLRHARGLFGGRSSYVRQIRRAIAAAGGADVVHVHDLARAACWLLPPRARNGARLVVTAHASDELGPSASPAGSAPEKRARRHARHVREVLARSDVVIAPSKWMASLAAALVPRKSGVVVIGHGPTDEGVAERTPHEGFHVVAMARFVEVKGLDLLLTAFARSLGPDPAARLTLAGEGPQDAALRARAEALGLAARVAFPGYVEGEERRRLLSGADLVAVPTRGDYETFGLTALDASAMGVPVVVAEGGALPERVANGEGEGVPSGDVSAWAAAIARLAGDPERRKAMGEAGMRTARSLSWDAVAEAHRKAYVGQGVVASVRPPPETATPPGIRSLDS